MWTVDKYLRLTPPGDSEGIWTATRKGRYDLSGPKAAAKRIDARCSLQVLRGEEDLRELLDDDDEDEDFTLDWDELMGPDPFGQGRPTSICPHTRP